MLSHTLKERTALHHSHHASRARGIYRGNCHYRGRKLLKQLESPHTAYCLTHLRRLGNGRGREERSSDEKVLRGAREAVLLTSDKEFKERVLPIVTMV